MDEACTCTDARACERRGVETSVSRWEAWTLLRMKGVFNSMRFYAACCNALFARVWVLALLVSTSTIATLMLHLFASLMQRDGLFVWGWLSVHHTLWYGWKPTSIGEGRTKEMARRGNAP